MAWCKIFYFGKLNDQGDIFISPAIKVNCELLASTKFHQTTKLNQRMVSLIDSLAKNKK